jgi:hypothetical protein
MSKPAQTKESPNIAALIAGGIGVAALLVWIGSLWLPAPDETSPAERAEKAPEKAAAPPPSPPAAAAPPVAPPAPATSVAPPAPVAVAPNLEPRTAPAEPRHADAPQAPARAPAAASRQPPPRDSNAPPQKPAMSTQRDAPPSPSTNTPRDAAQPATSAAANGRKSAAGADPAVAAMRGRYVGNLFSSASSEMIGLTLVISAVEDGVVTGTASLGGRGCNGDYPMRGKLESGQLQLKATRNGGPAGDCPLGLMLAVQGDRLAGASHSGDKVQLRK